MPNEHHWPTYRRLLNQAIQLEKAGADKAALEVYREIVTNYCPVGAEYYRRPAMLLEAVGDLEGALVFVRLAILNHMHLSGAEKEAVMIEFVPWAKGLSGQLGHNADDIIYRFGQEE